jgi:hypothetical protein
MDSLSKADRYRKEATKCYELAKNASPAFLGDCYRRVAVQYLFMAEAEQKLAEQQARSSGRGMDAAGEGGEPCLAPDAGAALDSCSEPDRRAVDALT